VRLCHSAALLVFAASGLTVAQVAPEFHFSFTEKPGPYSVGLRVAEQYDRSRDFATIDESGKPITAQGPRPLQILVWYPAEKSSGKTMTFGDYSALIQTEASFDKPIEHGKSQAFVEQYMHGITALPAWATRGATMQAGQFPVVIYAPGLNAPATENIELCEYLASNGYVVMASPSMGAASRTMTVDLAGANAEARDMSFLIDFAKTLPDTEMSEVAAMGYSWGGMAALFEAARDKRVLALISLDGSFRYSAGMVQDAGDVHPDQMMIPLLVFSRAEETLETWDAMHHGKQGDAAPNVLNEWTHGDLLHIHLLGVSHIQFSSLYQRSERFGKEALQFSPADYSLQEGAESYNWMARYTLEFLDAYLKRNPAAMEFLRRTPAENHVPKHLMAAQFRPAKSKQ
jgi:pimeloyl-ACP methyl ester carboxylesterase